MQSLGYGILPCSRGPSPQHRTPGPHSGPTHHNCRATPTRKTHGGYRLRTMVSSFHHPDEGATLPIAARCITERRAGGVAVVVGDAADGAPETGAWSQGESNPRYRRERPAS